MTQKLLPEAGGAEGRAEFAVFGRGVGKTVPALKIRLFK